MTSLSSNIARSASRARTLSQSSSSAARGLHATKPRQAIVMPYLSPMMNRGNVAKWRKQEGDSFRTGEVLVSIESDFHEVDVRAVNSGILGKILIPNGTKGVKAEEVIALVCVDAQEFAAMRGSAGASSSASTSSSSSKHRSSPAMSPLRPTSPSTLISPRSPLSRPVTAQLERSPNPLHPSALHRASATGGPVMHEAEMAMATGMHTSAVLQATSQNDDDGQAIRRMMRNKFVSHSQVQSPASMGSGSGNPSSRRNSTTAYFDGIL